MELSNENIDRLIVRYLSGNLELQDKRVLETWISNNQDNYDYFLKMKNLWEVTHPAFDVRSISTTKALSRIKLKMGLREKRVIRIYRYWSRVAAVLIIPILFALIYMVADRFVEQDYSKIQEFYYYKICDSILELDIYQKININKYVCIEGKLCDNTKNFSVEISNIQLEQSNFRSSSALADLGFKGENSKGGSDCSILIY